MLSSAGATPWFVDILAKPQAFPRGLARQDRQDALERGKDLNPSFRESEKLISKVSIMLSSAGERPLDLRISRQSHALFGASGPSTYPWQMILAETFFTRLYEMQILNLSWEGMARVSQEFIAPSLPIWVDQAVMPTPRGRRTLFTIWHVFHKNSLRQASPFGLTKQLCPHHEGAAHFLPTGGSERFFSVSDSENCLNCLI